MKRKLQSRLKSKSRTIDKGRIRSVLIACEDSVSAPTYFNKILCRLKETNKLSLDSLIIPHTGKTHPSGVLKDLMLYKSQSGKTFEDYDSCWIVIDRDKSFLGRGGHSKKDFNRTLKKAKKFKINVAYSNPSFELWYLLHFTCRKTPIDRHKVVELVVEHIKTLDEDKYRNLAVGNIKSEKMTKQIFKDMQELQKTAIINAKKLKRFHKEKRRRVDPENANPLTNIDKLIIELNNIDKLC